MEKPLIWVENLSRYYQIYQKEPGLIGTARSFFQRRYTNVKAVEDVSFTINEGELVGFIGPNGAGKTTTLKMLSGLLYPTAGKASVLGFTPWLREARFQKQFSLVMGQKNQLWWDLPAIESFQLNKAIYEISDREYKKVLSELVELLGVSEILKIQVRKLSLGERMKCELIAALLHSPKILFLDEPTIGLDVVMQKKMREFIYTYNRQHKATIILTSHYMEDVKELCSRVIMIDRGHLAFDGPLSKIIEEYADHKILSVVLGETLNKESLTEVGEVVGYHFPKVVIKVPRKGASAAAAKLFEIANVDDLTIEEPPIEDIIRELFSGKDIA